MTSLEQIVLPLEQSRQLMEHGIALDTAMVWVYVKDANGKIVLTVMPRRDASAACLGADCDGQKVICGAWVLSELLDAIRAKQPYAVVQCGNRRHDCVGSERSACSAMQPEGCSDIRYGDTDLLAAYALLLEVAQ